MFRVLAPMALLVALPGCIVGKAVGATASAAGTVVETGWDAATTTKQEADEDRGKAIRKEDERQRKEQERAAKAAREQQEPQD